MPHDWYLSIYKYSLLEFFLDLLNQKKHQNKNHGLKQKKTVFLSHVLRLVEACHVRTHLWVGLEGGPKQSEWKVDATTNPSETHECRFFNDGSIFPPFLGEPKKGNSSNLKKKHQDFVNNGIK